jgi:hypothetical protein
MLTRFSGLLLALLFGGSQAVGQSVNDFMRGADVSLQLATLEMPVVRGELIAVSHDSIWLLGDAGLAAVPVGYVRGASLKQHSLDGKAGLIWTLVGGLVTSGALTAACASVEGDCGAVFVVSMASWALVGGVSALSLEVSSRRRFKTPDIGGQLRGYARFPQGVPAGLDRNAIGLRMAVRTSVPPPF